MRTLVIGAAMTAAAVCGLSAANAQQPVDNYEAVALTQGQYAQAIPVLAGRLRSNPTDESLLLNLAMAYRKSGDVAKADALYRRVLFQDDVVLNGVGGVNASSHDLARAGMALNQPR